MFQVSFERGEGDGLIGGPPSPEQDSNENVISVFVCKVVDPDNPFGTSVSRTLILSLKVIHFDFDRQSLIAQSGRRGGLTCSALNSVTRGLGSSPGPGPKPWTCFDDRTNLFGMKGFSDIFFKSTLTRSIRPHDYWQVSMTKIKF